MTDIKKDPPDICTLRFTRVVFGVTASPFLLNTTLWYHLEQFSDSHPDLVRRLLHSTYVDDIITGASTEEAFQQSKGILQRGGFNIEDPDKFPTTAKEDCYH